MKFLKTILLIVSILVSFNDFYASGAGVKWATYFGGNTYATGVATDDSGNVYITGVTEDSTIATSGAYRTNLEKVERNAVNGYYTVYNTFLAKFNSSGALEWCTYFGASSDDELADGDDTLRSIFPAGNNIATDKNGNVYIAGITPDTTGIATTGAYQTKNPGAAAFIAKFRGSGSLAWASYYGSNMDAGDYNIPGGAPFPDVGGVSLTSDASGNVYITGSTFSSTGIATKGAYQTSYGGGSTSFAGGGGDAFLAKFDSTGDLDWGTYFGGSGYDGGYGVSVDASQNIYLAGFTTSKGLASSGAYQTSFAGKGSNAFLAKFSGSGNLTWATYFGDGNGFATGVSVDRSGNVYLIGNTDNGIGTSGTYQSTVFAGSSSAFLAKFNGGGSRVWATYYGGVSKEANSVCIDALGNVFVTGFTVSGAFVASCNPNQSSYGGGSDAYLAEFSNTGYLLYGRYIGGTNEDIGFGIALDGRGNIYIGGTTSSTKRIATSGAYQTIYKDSTSAGNYDAFLAKFSNLLITDVGISAVQIPKNTICISTQPVTAQLKNYGDFVLDSVTINWSVNNAVQPTYHWKGKLLPDSSVSLSLGSYSFTPGKFEIQAETSMPNGILDSLACDDTAGYNVTVLANPVPNTGKDHGICIGDTAQLGAYPPVSGIAYSWTSKPAGFTSTISYPVATPTASATYYLTETIKAVGCTGTDSIRITVNPNPVANGGGNHTICAGSGYSLGTLPLNNCTYFWVSDPAGFVSKKANPVVSPPTDTTVYYLQVFDTITGCNSNPDSAIIFLKQSPPVPNAGNNQTVCAGTSVALGANPATGNSYKWSSDPAGFSATVSNPTVKVAANTTYYLTATLNATGCSKTDSVIIKTNPLPKPDAGKPKNICPAQQVSLGYGGTTGDTYQWQSIPAGFSSTLSNIIVNPSLSTIYILSETNAATGCNNNDSVKITVVPLPGLPVIDGYDLVCGNDTPLNYTVNYDTGATWKWAIEKGKIVSGQGTNSVLLLFDSGNDTIFVTETNSTGCSSAPADKYVIRQNPDAHFKVLSDSPVYVFKAIDTTEKTYKWDFGDGTTGSQYETSHQYPFTKDSLVKVSLTINSAAGCPSVFDTTIDIRYFQSDKFNIRVFPNPFETNALIIVDLAQPAHVNISVYDALGRFIQKIADAQQPAESQTYEIKPIVLQWGPGMYFLKVSVNGDVYIRPVIKN